MKPLSEKLEALAGRIKELEDSATATFEANKARLETRRHEIEDAFTRERDDFESAVDAGRAWWNEARASVVRPFEELRLRIEKHQGEHELRRALRVAEAAEQDAVMAIELAQHWLNVAEYAVIDATLARMAADDLAAAQPDVEPEVVTTGGAS